MAEDYILDNHRQYRELAAWALLNPLTPGDRLQLEAHLGVCRECRDAFNQYKLLVSEGMPILAAQDSHAINVEEQDSWDTDSVQKNIFDGIRADQRRLHLKQEEWSAIRALRRLTTTESRPARFVLAAMCLLSVVGLVAYRATTRGHVDLKSTQVPSGYTSQPAPKDKEPLLKTEASSDMEANEIARLKTETLRKDQELARVRVDLRNLQDREHGLLAAIQSSNEQSQNAVQQRDALATQLQEVQQSSSEIQSQAATLRSERDEALTRSAVLESRAKELAATVRNQERRLADDEKFLASDRDIRDLMGARQLYIADVFDVDSRSLTRKPYGRVFYTQGKSLIFYAFDLDGEEHKNDTPAYQVWGRNASDEAKPLNLGILYMDNETNRRWVLRFDNPKQLAEIDAVFVTIEPQGGSRKPTGKPFLYALLRKEANHP